MTVKTLDKDAEARLLKKFGKPIDVRNTRELNPEETVTLKCEIEHLAIGKHKADANTLINICGMLLSGCLINSDVPLADMPKIMDTVKSSVLDYAIAIKNKKAA